jgi:hypothetical protein
MFEKFILDDLGNAIVAMAEITDTDHNLLIDHLRGLLIDDDEDAQHYKDMIEDYYENEA